MTRAHPKQRPSDLYPKEELSQPFESENAMAEREANVLRQQRKSSGDLPDQPTGNPVGEDRPFKQLRTGR